MLDMLKNPYPYHRLTLPKGVYSFRYFLSPMCIPNLLMHVFIMPNPFVICSYIYFFFIRLFIHIYICVLYLQTFNKASLTAVCTFKEQLIITYFSTNVAMEFQCSTCKSACAMPSELKVYILGYNTTL